MTTTDTVQTNIDRLAQRAINKLGESEYNAADYIVAILSTNRRRWQEDGSGNIEHFIAALPPVLATFANDWLAAQAAREQEEARQAAEYAKARAEANRALEQKRATMSKTRQTTDVIMEHYDSGGPVRIIEGDEYDNLTADQLREAIKYGQNEPHVVQSVDGTFYLLNALYRDYVSSDFNPSEMYIDLYEDGTFEVIEEVEEDEEEDE